MVYYLVTTKMIRSRNVAVKELERCGIPTLLDLPVYDEEDRIAPPPLGKKIGSGERSHP
jgi:hypothetical protein